MPKNLIIDDDIPEYMINDFKYAMEQELKRQRQEELDFKMEENIKIFLKAQREANEQQQEADKQQQEADKQRREAEQDLKMNMIDKRMLRKIKEKLQMEEAKRQIREIEKKNKSNKIKP